MGVNFPMSNQLTSCVPVYQPARKLGAETQAIPISGPNAIHFKPVLQNINGKIRMKHRRVLISCVMILAKVAMK